MFRRLTRIMQRPSTILIASWLSHTNGTCSPALGCISLPTTNLAIYAVTAHKSSLYIYITSLVALGYLSYSLVPSWSLSQRT